MSRQTIQPYDPTTRALVSLIDALVTLDDQLYDDEASTKPSMTSLGSTDGPLFDAIQELDVFFSDCGRPDRGLSYLVANFTHCEKPLRAVETIVSTSSLKEVADQKLIRAVKLKIKHLELRVKRSTESQLLLQEHLRLLVSIGPSRNDGGFKKLYGDLTDLRDRYFLSGLPETLTEYRRVAELVMQAEVYKAARASRPPGMLELREKKLEECSLNLEVASMMTVLD
jgi:hypothetical protein